MKDSLLECSFCGPVAFSKRNPQAIAGKVKISWKYWRDSSPQEGWNQICIFFRTILYLYFLQNIHSHEKFILLLCFQPKKWCITYQKSHAVVVPPQAQDLWRQGFSAFISNLHQPACHSVPRIGNFCRLGKVRLAFNFPPGPDLKFVDFLVWVCNTVCNMHQRSFQACPQVSYC